MSRIIIRQVDADEDHDLLMAMQLAVMPEDKPVRTDEPLQWWIAYDGATPVAFAALSRSVQRARRGYLSAAGVLPGYRGLGLQKRLIRVREAFARRIGMDCLVTDTVSSNPASANSLIACGFRAFWPERAWRFGNFICFWKKELHPPAGAV